MDIPQHLAHETTQIAKAAGVILLKHLGQLDGVEHKGSIDLVTAADRASEVFLVRALADLFPAASILAEEGGGVRRSSDYLWVVDPLDGTTNFAHGYPVFAVSIALLKDGLPVLGVVHDPSRGETFVAELGGGAWLGTTPLRLTSPKSLSDALVVTGFPYDVRTNSRNNLPQFAAMLRRARGVRRDGSAALNLAYLAAGRFDGFWEEGLSPWDVAAGALLVREAGGTLTGYDGSALNLWGGHVVAAAPGLHKEMLDVLNQIEGSGELPSVELRARPR